MNEFLLYGAGGHAKVVADSILRGGGKVIGIFDDNLSRCGFFDIPFLGAYNPQFSSETPIILAFANHKSRLAVIPKIKHPFGTWIDSSALVAKSVEIGEGTVVLHAATIQADANLGRHVIVNTGACVDHECILGDFVHISPNVTLCGNVKVGSGSMIGAGAVVIPNLKMGREVTVGAGSVVIKEVPDFATVVGNPAKILKIAT